MIHRYKEAKSTVIGIPLFFFCKGLKIKCTGLARTKREREGENRKEVNTTADCSVSPTPLPVLAVRLPSLLKKELINSSLNFLIGFSRKQSGQEV